MRFSCGLRQDIRYIVSSHDMYIVQVKPDHVSGSSARLLFDSLIIRSAFFLLVWKPLIFVSGSKRLLAFGMLRGEVLIT